MSHFTVIVVGEDIESQMAKYNEATQNREYLEFQDEEDERLKEYNEDEVEIVVLADGSLHNIYEEQFYYRVPGSFDKEKRYPEGSTLRKGKFQELYATFEIFMEEWCGSKGRDEEKGRYGYWHNPNSKYDWYSMGGRWSGYFKSKDGIEGYLGTSGAFGNQPQDKWYDSLKLSEIDILGMKEVAVMKANKKYDEIESLLQGRVYPSWPEIREKHGDNISAAREEYHNHEVVKDFNKNNFHFFGDFHEIFGNSRENYVEKIRNSVMVPYAVVKDGQWYQKGEMGWFGMSSNDMSQEEWNNEFWKMIDSLDPNTQLTLLDCHI